MGMSTHIVGFMPADQEWDKMLKVFEVCKTAGVAPPEEVARFFGYEDPTGKPGAEVDIEEHVKEWNDNYRSGFEVVLDGLPDKVKVIRFYNSW
jgi:hypothetical protein